jgi:hypothetical protein
MVIYHQQNQKCQDYKEKAMADALQFMTNAVGRFISGSLTQKRTRDNNNREIAEEKQRFEFGVAFPKTDPDMQRLFGEFYQYLSGLWVQDQARVAALNNWFQTLDGMSMKISDGDKPNARGAVNENTVGCFVFWFSSMYAPKVCDSAFQEIDPESVKRGYFVQVAGNIADNGLAAPSWGMYLNPTHVRFVAEGDEIKGGIDAATAFSGVQTPASLPPGARPPGAAVGMPGATPAAPAAPVPGMPAVNPTTAPAPVQTAPVTMPGHTPAPPAAPPSTASPSNPPQMPQPHTAILNPATPAAPAAPVPGMPGLPGQQ